MDTTIRLEPLASAGVQPEWLAPLVKEIWPARAEEINALFTNGGGDIDPKTDHPYAIKLGDRYVGITGFYRYDDHAVGLCWHGVLPSVRRHGISRAAFDKVRLLAVERYPNTHDIVELIPDDRAADLVPYFSKLGFGDQGEVATFDYLPKSTTWRVYRAPLTVRGHSVEPAGKE